LDSSVSDILTDTVIAGIVTLGRIITVATGITAGPAALVAERAVECYYPLHPILQLD